MNTNYSAWFDGGCFPKNPGGYASYGGVIAKAREIVWEGSGLVIPSIAGTTNKLAEYAGYIAVLKEMESRSLKEEPITVYGDSELVIKQMKGVQKIKKGVYVPLARKAQGLTKRFPNIQLEWIPRDKNSVADALATQALFQNGSICIPCITADESQHDFCSCACHQNGQRSDKSK